MTTRPRLRLGSHLLPGLLAVALFAVLVAVFVGAGFAGGRGFESGVSITASIGYAMFDLAGGQVESNGFLAAFEIIDIVLVAALVGAVMLARREDENELVPSFMRTDGGEQADGPRAPSEPGSDGSGRSGSDRDGPQSDASGRDGEGGER